MRKDTKPTKTIDEYIHTFPREIQSILRKIRLTIHQAAPQAMETISYGMPAFKLNGKVLVYFAAWKKHIGFYATPTGNAAFKQALANYKVAKGSIQFPLDQAMPYRLITRMVKLRVQQIKLT